ncbi:hypothetical protein [Streptomyces sp. NPDC056949]|uniref:hypothetical protein n=1 Tax=Streptomyces sp. NPDC056949 TaxID=3345976 RepID=UPI003624C65D
MTLFFLTAAPGAAIGSALRGLGPWGRWISAVAGAFALDLLVAEAMIATHRWSVTGGIVTIAVISVAGLLAPMVPARRLPGRAPGRRDSRRGHHPAPAPMLPQGPFTSADAFSVRRGSTLSITR